MNKQIKPYNNSAKSKREQIENMFNTISSNYDKLNGIITWGMDKKWRKSILTQVSQNNPISVLDIATGTGDMAILLSQTTATKIIGIDISQGMLDVANKKIKALNLQDRVKIEVQDVENLQLPNSYFDVVTVVYGIRNFENLKKGLAEIYRVMRKDAVLLILETSVPQNPIIRVGYKIYTNRIMPVIASFFSKNKTAYTYLATSANNFPYGENLLKIIEIAGFKSASATTKMFGISTLYYAKK